MGETKTERAEGNKSASKEGQICANIHPCSWGRDAVVSSASPPSDTPSPTEEREYNKENSGRMALTSTFQKRMPLCLQHIHASIHKTHRFMQI